MGHVYFDEEGAAATSAGAPPQAQHQARVGGLFSSRLAHCCSRARVDYNAADPCYVFKAVRSPDSAAVAASLSNNAIKLYAVGVAGLSHAADLHAHEGTISDVQFPLSDLPHALYSCSRDGTLKAWDLRTQQQAERYSAAQQELYSFGVCGHLVAAGGQGDVHFWDRRTQRPMLSFDDMHMDDVTQVLFHAASSKLVTASQDGLVAVHDIAGGLSQDDGFIAALNVGTSVEQLGLYGAGGQHMWCRTGTETLQIWDWLAATVEGAPGGDTAVADLADARQLATAAAAGSSAAALVGEVDYLIGCHYDAATQQLLLVAGTNAGAAAVFPIAEQQHRAGLLSGESILRPPALVLHGCHTDVVRSVDFFEGPAAQRLLCVTAGEDAQLGLWTLDEATAAAAGAAPVSSMDSGDSAGPSRRHHQHAPSARHSPY